MPQWLATLIVDRIMKAFLTWITDLWKKTMAQQKSDAAIDERTKKQAEKLKDSVTDDEDEAAARDIINRKS